MALAEKQLSQSRPAGTIAVSIYSPGASTTAIIKNITVCNTTNTQAKFRVFIDDSGTTYDESTAIFWDSPIKGNTTVSITSFWAMNNSSGNFAVRTDTANALTFTISGAEIT